MKCIVCGKGEIKVLAPVFYWFQVEKEGSINYSTDNGEVATDIIPLVDQEEKQAMCDLCKTLYRIDGDAVKEPYSPEKPYKDLDYPRTIKCVRCEKVFSEAEIYLKFDEECCPYCHKTGALMNADCGTSREFGGD